MKRGFIDLRRDYQSLMTACNKLLPKKEGQAKTYEKVSDYKGKKDKVDRDIKYALKYLKTIDEKAWRHFRLSIKNRLGRIGYESIRRPWLVHWLICFFSIL